MRLSAELEALASLFVGSLARARLGGEKRRAIGT